MLRWVLAGLLIAAATPVYAAGRSVCGGFAGFACGKSYYCFFGDKQRCGAADQMGQCRKRPKFCTREYRPVCGCDGRTYGNRCSANAAGVDIYKVGGC